MIRCEAHTIYWNRMANQKTFHTRVARTQKPSPLMLAISVFFCVLMRIRERASD